MATDASSASKGKLLVLGGTGFAGSKIVETALGQGFEVVAMSRRGKPAPGSQLEGKTGLEWRTGDATNYEEVEQVVAEGDFVGAVHAIGMLLESDLNQYASGSGSVPRPGTTYDDITRKTALNLIRAFTESKASGSGAGGAVPPFAFISAAEAGWTLDQYLQGTPGEWLHRYLVAKRAVEDELKARADANQLRPLILRPSLIWSWDNPGALPPVAAFTVANRLGVPGIDQPVMVEEVARAVVQGLLAEGESGVLRSRDMKRLANNL